MSRSARLPILILLVLTAGCGGVVPTMLRTVASTSALVSNSYRAIRSYDADKQAKIVARAKAGDPSGAEAELNDYILKRDAVLKVIDAASVAVESGYAVVPSVGQALDKRRRADISAWISTLIKVGADVVGSLTAIGIRAPIPGALTGGVP